MTLGELEVKKDVTQRLILRFEMILLRMFISSFGLTSMSYV